MSETANTAEIAKKILNEIFRVFFWELRPLEDSNFDCVSGEHLTPTGKPKKSHPCDVLFHYFDPYLNRLVYLHTDLKSYSKSSLKDSKIREALNSLSMAVDCATYSSSWKTIFPRKVDEIYEVRGLLFVANHDNKAPLSFNQKLRRISKNNLKLAKNQIIHVLGPKEISDLYSIATDIKLSISDKKLSEFYRFFYPDLILWKRQVVDDERTAATIETLLSPYFILKHSGIKDEHGNQILRSGSMIYYSRIGDTVEEFMYLIDSLLRYQLVNANEQIRIRMFNGERSGNFKSNFDKAKTDYCDMWGFEGDRADEIKDITIDAISQITPNYSPAEIGWKEQK